MGMIKKPQGYTYTVTVGRAKRFPFLGREIVYMIVTKNGEARIVVAGFFLKEEDEGIVVQEVEVREKPKKSQISPDQKKELRESLVIATDISDIYFWPETFHPTC